MVESYTQGTLHSLGAPPEPLSGWLTNLSFMPSPHDRVYITPSRYLRGIVPAYVCYYAMAVLVIQPGTRLYRLALLPAGLYTAFHAATAYDLTNGNLDRKYMNIGNGVGMFALAMRMIEWAIQGPPLERNHSKKDEESPRSIWKDAGNLACNVRGIGWTWSKGWRMPKETRPTHSNSAFLLRTFLWWIRCVLVFDSIHYLIQFIEPDGMGSHNGAPLLDYTLPPAQRYFRSTGFTILCGLVIHLSMTLHYNLTTLMAFALSRQDPKDWPPVSEAPWLATSLSEFWGWRWHQTFRRSFIELGAKPVRYFFGEVGGVFGAFMLSALLHDMSIWGMARGTDFTRFGDFFALNALGMVLEQVWQRSTGKKVGGVIGWAWTMVWVLVTGHLIVDAFLSRGLAGCVFIPEELRPAKALGEYIIRRLK